MKGGVVKILPIDEDFPLASRAAVTSSDRHEHGHARSKQNGRHGIRTLASHDLYQAPFAPNLSILRGIWDTIMYVNLIAGAKKKKKEAGNHPCVGPFFQWLGVVAGCCCSRGLVE